MSTAVFKGPSAHPGLLAELIETSQAVDESDHLLTAGSMTRILELYRFIARELEASELPYLLSSEYGSDEFLACVDSSGEKVRTPSALVEDIRRFSACEPGIKNWFRIGQVPDWKQPVLLPARWLCHLLGLRHGTIHLILTIPNPDEKLLVQVRSMHKNSSPGCYDLPVAGHVDGLQSYEETLRKETREEIGLDINLLTEMRTLGGYLDCNTDGEGFFYNCEYHRVFSARLDPRLLATLVPLPGEVASLALFPPEELHALRAAFSRYFAPGIQQTFDQFLPNS